MLVDEGGGDVLAHPNSRIEVARGVKMDNAQFAVWQQLIREKTGMVLAEDRRTFLITKLLARMRIIGCESFDAYYALLTSGPQSFIEWTEFVDRITTHETRFFRDQIALDFLTNKILPKFTQTLNNLHIWSAGCSTGEEAYGLAMLVDEYNLENQTNLRFAITATDISLPCLSTARAGIYSKERISNLPQKYISRYFARSGQSSFAIKDPIKQRVCFAQMNLLEAGTKPIGAMDLIYCQKVLIYLEQSVRHKMLDRMVLHLKPGGYLVLGIGEVTGWKNANVERVSGTDVLVFRSVVTE